MELRAEGLTLQATADRLQEEIEEASHITKDTLASLLRRQQTVDRDDRNLRLDPSTVHAVHVLLHEAFGAVRWDRLNQNPADFADPPRVPKKPDSVETCTSESLRTFLSWSASSGDREHALWVLRPETVSASFLRRQAGLDLPRLTIKGLRHTWATLALKQGIHPKVVQERLGHSTVGITLNIHSHTNPALHAAAAEEIAGLILGPESAERRAPLGRQR